MGNEVINTDVLVVGGGTGGTAAAIQAARRGVKTILVTEFPWLGGMLTSAGVSAPDGNELAALQTGIWGAFLRELQRRHPEGLDHGWVSFFDFDPRVGAEIFADWVRDLPNLHWIVGQVPLEVLREGNCVSGVRFADFTVKAQVTVDATELGDLLALGEIPYYWGWELQSEWGEPSAPVVIDDLMRQYPVQAPTWVVIMQDFGADGVAPEIPAPPGDVPDRFVGAWDGYGPDKFINYGKLPGNLLMINWPQKGNDYDAGVGRLIASESERSQFLQECFWHSQSFARFIQANLGRRYGLAANIFPSPIVGKTFGYIPKGLSASFALHPYYRESRRLQGVVTIQEGDILPVSGGQVASLPMWDGQVSSIAVGNYANDHHYTNFRIPLQSKSIRWGGRWTGTPFSIPYGCLVPAIIDGLLVGDKNISVSHIANGATRLQPVVLSIGQAAGMAAALCVERQCQPRDLPIRLLQEALLTEPIAPAAIIPLFNLTPDRPDWIEWQRYYLNYPENYPQNGYCPVNSKKSNQEQKYINFAGDREQFSGIFHRYGEQDYSITINSPVSLALSTLKVVTLQPEINRLLENYPAEHSIAIYGRINLSGNWLLVDKITRTD